MPGTWPGRRRRPPTPAGWQLGGCGAQRSAGRAAGGGDADREAESDDDDEAESDDDRERIAKLEAIEHGEVDWDDDDVYSLGRGQSWSSVDHLA